MVTATEQQASAATGNAADVLRREADRLDAEGKWRKWGLLDANHELTDDGTAGRFVALEPDQLRFAAILAERLGATDTDDGAVIEDLRALHRNGTSETTLGLAALFEVMARGTWGETWRERRTEPERWQYDRHPDCRSCACPPRSASQCGGPSCPVTILSVHAKAPEYCSDLCRSRAGTQRRELLNVAVLRVLYGHPAGLDEAEVARQMGVDTSKVREAVRRVNQDGTLVLRARRTDTDRACGFRWHLTLTIPSSPEPAAHPGVAAG